MLGLAVLELVFGDVLFSNVTRICDLLKVLIAEPDRRRVRRADRVPRRSRARLGPPAAEEGRTTRGAAFHVLGSAPQAIRGEPAGRCGPRTPIGSHGALRPGAVKMRSTELEVPLFEKVQVSEDRLAVTQLGHLLGDFGGLR